MLGLKPIKTLPIREKIAATLREAFIGGGALYFALSEHEILGERFINDKSDELVALYKNIANNNVIFFDYLHQLNHNWNLLVEMMIGQTF